MHTRFTFRQINPWWWSQKVWKLYDEVFLHQDYSFLSVGQNNLKLYYNIPLFQTVELTRRKQAERFSKPTKMYILLVVNNHSVAKWVHIKLFFTFLNYHNNLSNTLCDATKKVSRRRTDFVANFPYIVLRVPLRQEIKKATKLLLPGLLLLNIILAYA